MLNTNQINCLKDGEESKYRERSVGSPLLFDYCLDNASDRWLKKFSHVRTNEGFESKKLRDYSSLTPLTLVGHNGCPTQVHCPESNQT